MSNRILKNRKVELIFNPALINIFKLLRFLHSYFGTIWNPVFSFTVYLNLGLSTFQVFRSHTYLVVSILDSTNVEQMWMKGSRRVESKIGEGWWTQRQSFFFFLHYGKLVPLYPLHQFCLSLHSFPYGNHHLFSVYESISVSLFVHLFCF